MKRLFGGAAEMAIPEGYVDVSAFRQVPDNQEVYLNRVNDDSIIIELLEHDPKVDIQRHFDILAEENGATEKKVIDRSGDFLHGTQMVRKFGSSTAPADTVHIYLGLLMRPGDKTDVLVSWNFPKAPGLDFHAFRHFVGSFRVIDSSLFKK